MRQAVRAIIINDDNLLVMHRNKFGKEYDTLPGGNIEPGETHEQALMREVMEEATITFTDPKLVFVEEAGDPYGTQYVYVCTYQSGTPALAADSEEALINKMGQNLYEPRWVPVATLPDMPFLSERLKRTILQAIRTGFPETPQRVTN